MVLFRRRKGPCPALVWMGHGGLYRCGALARPDVLDRQALPVVFGFLARPLAFVLRRAGARWIACATGCDSTLEPVPSHPTSAIRVTNDMHTKYHD